MRTLKFTQLILALALSLCLFDVNAQTPYLSDSEWNVFINHPEDIEQRGTFTVSNGQIVGFRYEWGDGYTPLEGYAPSDLLLAEPATTGDSFLVRFQPLLLEACVASLVTYIFFKLVVIVNPVAGLIVELALNIAVAYSMSYFCNAKIPVINNLGLLANSLSIKKERILNRKTNNRLLAFV